MLFQLRVKNLALVDRVDIEFQPGLNMITGETGAGKSILMGALGLLLGERADKTLIRSGEEQCGAEAVYQLDKRHPVHAHLDEQGLNPCEDGRLIVRRIVKASGSGQAWVNDSPVTVQALSALGNLMVDMHGPHDHQSLLDRSAQLDILDAFGHLQKERQACADLYGEWLQTNQRRDELTGHADNLEAELDVLSFKIKEMEEAGLSVDEEQEVEQEHRIFGNAQRIVELAGVVMQALTEGEAPSFDQVAAASRATEELQRLLPDAGPWHVELNEISSRIQELAVSVSRRVEQIDADPSRLEWLDQRLTTYQKMKRKYGPGVPDVLAQLEKARARLSDLQSRDERLAELDRERARLDNALRKNGLALRKKREKVAAELAAAITAELKELGFPDGRFDVPLEPAEPGPTGMDAVDFGFEPNVGEAMRPLRLIASSGEISRVMLAIKSVLARHDKIPVLVFDEIDANIGGEMGRAIGRKLGEVARHHQVICITHLPQVAVFGRAHFAVTKQVQGGRTLSRVEALDADGRVEEIARMLGGRDLTGVTVKHARELLEHVPS